MVDFKKLTINLSMFSTDQGSKSSNSASKSPRNFVKNEIVGLGIIAAMNDGGITSYQDFASAKSIRSSILGITSPRSISNPIPIISDSNRVLIDFSKSDFVDENCNLDSTITHSTACSRVFQTSVFLTVCYLCEKKLQGIDIFMYRGEKAFCSAECRSVQMASDDRKEKCGPFSYSSSLSPCSGPMMFFAGVAAA